MKVVQYENKIFQPQRRRVKVHGKPRALVLTGEGDWETVEPQPQKKEVNDARNPSTQEITSRA